MCLFCDIADHKKEAYIVDETKNTKSKSIILTAGWMAGR